MPDEIQRNGHNATRGICRIESGGMDITLREGDAGWNPAEWTERYAGRVTAR